MNYIELTSIHWGKMKRLRFSNGDRHYYYRDNFSFIKTGYPYEERQIILKRLSKMPKIPDDSHYLMASTCILDNGAFWGLKYPYIKNQTLEDTTISSSLSLLKRYQLVMEIVKAIDLLHFNHIIHGDLNGSQILIEKGNPPHIYLTDLEETVRTPLNNGEYYQDTIPIMIQLLAFLYQEARITFHIYHQNIKFEQEPYKSIIFDEKQKLTWPIMLLPFFEDMRLQEIKKDMQKIRKWNTTIRF